MNQHMVQNGDHIQAIDIEINGMHHPSRVWVVITRSGLVLAVADPPVGRSLTSRPARVDFPPQPSK